MLGILLYNLCIFIPTCWAYGALVEVNVLIRKEYYRTVERSARTNQDLRILYNEFTTYQIVDNMRLPSNREGIGGSIKTIASDEI